LTIALTAAELPRFRAIACILGAAQGAGLAEEEAEG
jgi:hypothetical protein